MIRGLGGPIPRSLRAIWGVSGETLENVLFARSLTRKWGFMTFDDIEIDLERFELRKAGAPVAIEPKVFDLIRYLAGNANKLVSKDDLIENVWQGRIVSDAALSSAIKSARRAMGETDLASSRIKTVRGRGFRMVLPEVSTEWPAAQPEAKVIFTQPSLAVLAPKGAGDWGAKFKGV